MLSSLGFIWEYFFSPCSTKSQLGPSATSSTWNFSLMPVRWKASSRRIISTWVSPTDRVAQKFRYSACLAVLPVPMVLFLVCR
jgi:hypothetical protein